MAHIHITKELIAQYIPKNPIVLEAGAHIGRDTLKMSMFWPQGHIYAFEPALENFNLLIERIKNQTNVSCYQYALGQESGIQQLFFGHPPYNASSSLYMPTGYLKEHPIAQFEKESVEMVTIDSWAKFHNIHHIDFIWLDMQGGELNALKGGHQILKTVKALKIEVNLTERYKNIPLYPEIRHWIQDCGFTVVVESLHHGSWGDILCVRKD